MIVLTPRLDHLREYARLIPEAEDPEYVHQLRIATRRLDTFLLLSRLKVLRSDLRWIRRCASHLRDADVLLEREQPESLRRWLQEERVKARGELTQALQSGRMRSLITALKLLPPLNEKVAHKRLCRMYRDVLDAGTRVESKPDDTERMHFLRRRIKRLRYAGEWLSSKSKQVKPLQETLGQLNDVCVNLDVALAFPQRAELNGYVGALEKRRDKLAHVAFDKWQRARPKLMKELAQWKST